MTAVRGIKDWSADTLAELQALGVDDQGIAVGQMGKVTGSTSPGLYRCTVAGAASSTWVATGGGGGSADVVGPASATDNAITRFDTTTGKLIQNSAVTIDDSGNIAGVGTINSAALDPATGFAGYSLAYSVDFSTVSTQNLLTGGDAAKTIDGITWDALGTGNLSALAIGSPSGGLLATHNSNNPASWGFGLSALLSDLNADLGPNDDLLVVLVFDDTANADFETMGVRFVPSNTITYSSGTIWSCCASVGRTTGRAYVEHGTSAGDQDSAPNGFTSAEDPNLMIMEIRNGVVRMMLADPGNDNLPTNKDGFAIVGGYPIDGTTLSFTAPTAANARIQLASYAGNTSASFTPLWKKLAIYHRK